MCIYTPDLGVADKMKISVSSRNSTARIDLMLEQCSQNKAVISKINVLIQVYSDVSLSEKRINNLI